MKSRLRLPLLVVLTIAGYGYGVHGSVPDVPTGQWMPGPSLAQPREGAVSVALDDGRILVIGGRTAAGPVATVEALNANGSITVLPSMSVPRVGHTAVVLADGSVLVAGGTTMVATDQGTVEAPTSSAETFAPSSNTWSAASPLGVARSAHTATALADGRVLIAGGTSEQGPLDSMEVFEPQEGTFRAAGVLSAARAEAAAAVAGETRVLVVGGRNADGVLASADLVDVESGAVAQLALTSPRAGASATKLLEGTVFVAGGNDGQNDLATAEVIDPASGASLPAGSMAQPRQGHQATLLDHNATVLIVGGTNNGATVTAAEAFVPWTNQFAATNPPAAARTSAVVNSTSTQGVAVLAGGKASSGALVAPAELYGFATVKTDKDDYPPGMTVVITGSGWQPGETVHLVLHEVGTGEPDVPLIATANANGVIFNDVWAPDEHDDGVRFYLTATGVGATAQTTFTDRNPQSITVTPQSPGSITAGDSKSYDVKLLFGGNQDPCTVTLNVTGLPPGVGFSFGFDPNNQPSASTPMGPITVSRTLTIGTTASGPTATPPGTYNFSVTGTNGAGCNGPGPTPGTGTLVVDASTFSVTFNPAAPIADVDGSTQVLSVTIGGDPPTIVTNSQLPRTFTGIASGTNVSYTYSATVASTTAGKRYRWNTTSGTGSASGMTARSSSFNVTANSSVSASYQAQFLLTLATNPSGVGGATNPSPDIVSADGFYDDNTKVKVTAAALVTIDTASRYRFDHWTGDASGDTNPVEVTISAPRTVTAVYVTQYKLTLATSPSGIGTAPNPSANPSSTDGFYDSGTDVTVTAQTPVTIDATSRYRFDHWTGDVTPSPNTTNPLPVKMDQARSITAYYVVQWQFTLAITADVPNGLANISGGSTGEFYDADTELHLSASTPVADGVGKQWRFDNWTGDVPSSPNASNPVTVIMNGAKTVTANYIVQWQLTLAITAGVPSGLANISGGTNGAFYDTGTPLTLAAATLVADGADKQWLFMNWTGDVPTPPNSSGSINVTMNSPRSITANYVVQYRVTFQQVGITLDTGLNTVVTVDGVPKTKADLAAGVSKFVTENDTISYLFATPISTSPASDKQFELTSVSPSTGPATVTGPLTITGQYAIVNYTILYHQPIDQSTASYVMVNAGKNGRVIPVKVELFKDGTPVQTGKVLMNVTGSNCSGGAPTDLVQEYADAGSSNGTTNQFRWSAGSPGFWIYNLDTKALGLQINLCYRLDVYLNDTTGSNAVLASSSVFALFKPVK